MFKLFHKKQPKYALIIHGGCGDVSKYSLKEQNDFKKSLTKIVESGQKLLEQGKTAMDVAEHCVKLLEDDPLYNAGKGSVLNEKGKVEMDAAIMDGQTLKAGAVAGLTTAKNPIQAARLVMEKTNHVFLIGQGANQFVTTQKIPTRKPEYFILAKRKTQLKQAKQSRSVALDHSTDSKKGTVGAVVYDKYGNLAAATSTGGLVNKKFGRTGDSPLIGCGTYADNSTAGISCTGIGEDFIRTSLAKYISDAIHFKGYKAQKAAQAGKKYLTQKLNGYGGFILIDHQGTPTHAFTTKGLIRAWVKQGEQIQAELF